MGVFHFTDSIPCSMTLGLVGDSNPEKNTQKCLVSFISMTGCSTSWPLLNQDPNLTWDWDDFLPEKTGTYHDKP